MTNAARTNKLNSGDLLGSGVAHYDTHVLSRLFRSVTVVFYGPAGKEWTRYQPEVSDADMVAMATAGRPGTVNVYRGTRNVNTLRDTPSAEYRV